MSWGVPNAFNPLFTNASQPVQTPHNNFIANPSGNQIQNPFSNVQTTAAPHPAMLSSRAVGSGKRYRGVVVYYSTSKGFGFAHTDKPDVWKIYVHIYALEKCGVADLEVGMEIEFNVRENHKGKYACNVCPVLRDADGQVLERGNMPIAIPMFEGRQRGTLKSFDSQRLFGWVMCGDTEVFMTIYELRHDNMEQHLVPGTTLEFAIGRVGRGLTAYDIEVCQSSAGLGLNNQMNLPVVTPSPQQPQIPMAPPVALPLGSTNILPVGLPSPLIPSAGIAQSLTPEQINALIAATLLNSTQAWQFLPLAANQCISKLPSAPNTTASDLFPLQTQQKSEKFSAHGIFERSSSLCLGGSEGSSFFGGPQNPMSTQSPNSPLLRLPSMPTVRSPLNNLTNKHRDEENSSAMSCGWDELISHNGSMHSLNRKSSLSSLFDASQSGSSLDTSTWSSALLIS